MLSAVWDLHSTFSHFPLWVNHGARMWWQQYLDQATLEEHSLGFLGWKRAGSGRGAVRDDKTGDLIGFAAPAGKGYQSTPPVPPPTTCCHRKIQENPKLWSWNNEIRRCKSGRIQCASLCWGASIGHLSIPFYFTWILFWLDPWCTNIPTLSSLFAHCNLWFYFCRITQSNDSKVFLEACVLIGLTESKAYFINLQFPSCTVSIKTTQILSRMEAS